MNDIWVPVPGFPKYEVSPLGVLRNAATLIEIQPQINPGGYGRVSLHADGLERPRTVSVHRIVMAALRPEDFDRGVAEGRTVDHVDRDPGNNSVENLRMATGAEQSANAARPDPPPGCLAVVCTSPDGTRHTYPSTRDAARQTGVSQGSISRCARGEYATAGGFTWRFAHSEVAADLPGESWRTVVDAGIFPSKKQVLVSNMGRFKESAGGSWIVKTAAQLTARNG